MRVYSDSRDGTQIIETNATFPNGRKRRDFIATSSRLMCTSCDPIGRQEVCFSSYCVHVGDTAVFVFLNNGTLQETLPLSGCLPQYLEPSTDTVTGAIVFVACRPTNTGRPQYRELNYIGQQFELTSKVIPNGNDFPLTPHNGVFSGGQDDFGLQNDFFFYIWNNALYLEVVGGYEGPRQLALQAGVCDTKDALHAMPPRDNKPQFLLRCSRLNVTKWFIVTVDTPEDFSLEVTEINDSTGTPYASTTMIAFVDSNNLTVYEISNLRHYPGMKTFSGPIKQIDFLSSNQLLVVVSGQNHSLIDMPVFVRSVGARGVTELPSSVAYCPIGGTCLPHKLLNQNVLVLFIRNQSFYDAVFYNLTDPAQRLGTLPRFINRPQVVFYDRLPSPPAADLPPATLPIPSPPIPPPTSPPTPLLTPSPPTLPIVSTTTSNPVSLLAVPGPSSTSDPVLDPSSVLPGVPTLYPPLEPTPISPTDDSSQQMPYPRLTEGESIGISLSVVVVTIIVFAVVAVLGCYVHRRAKQLSECHVTSPMEETANSPPRDPPIGEEAIAVITLTLPPSSDGQPITLPPHPAGSQSSSGYSSLVHSRAHSPSNLAYPPTNAVNRQSNCSADSYHDLSHVASTEHDGPPDQARDEVAPPDGTSQGGDITSTRTPASAPPSTQTKQSAMVTGTLQTS